MGISINNVTVAGYLGKDPELRTTQNQTAVATLSLATTEVFEKNGQKQEQTEWHNVVVWAAGAESAAKHLKKGSPVLVEGKLQTRKWQDKEGKDRYTTEIVARRLHYLGGSPAQGAAQPVAGARQMVSAPAYPDAPGADVPF